MKSMKSMKLVALTVLIFILFSAVSMNAAQKVMNLNGQVRTMDVSKSIPAQLNYQGYLANAADSTAITATLEMTFRLFDTETKETELWSETHAMVDVRDGLFQVLLGSITTFPSNLFDGPSLWLQTEVGPEVLAPRKSLASVAFSQRAENADHATTADWTTDTQHALYADTAGYCPGTSAWTMDGDNIYRATGLVGIGLANPNYTLHLNGILGIGNMYQTEFPNYGFGPAQIKRFAIWDDFGGQDNPILGTFRQDDGTSFGELAFLSKAIGSTPRALAFRHGTIGTEGTETWFLGSTGQAYFGGNVGIGTSSPVYPLDVNGSIHASTYYGDGSNLTGISGTTDNDWAISGDDVYHEVGNVGIGTTNPTSGRLEALASSGTGVYGASGSGIGVFGYSASGQGVVGNSTGGHAGYFLGDVYVSGNTGFGVESPIAKLHVNGDINADSLYKIGGTPVLSTSGTKNLLVGAGAGANNTENNGTFVGYHAGYNNQGSYGTFVGADAGSSNEGSFNTFVGYQAGLLNTTDGHNTLVGAWAGENNDGSDNTFLGYLSGNSNTSGYNNTFLGSCAGWDNETGSHNIFIGAGASTCNTTGHNNTVLGTFAGYNNTLGSNNVFIGYQAGYYEIGSNKLYIANSWDSSDVLIYGDFSTGNVGLGTLSPERRLHIVGVNPRILIEASSSNPEVNFRHSGELATSNWSLYKEAVSGDLRFYQNGDRMTIEKNTGNVGIGTADPAQKLHVVGDIYCTGKLTSDGGNDPPYVLYNKESRAAIVERVAAEVPEEKRSGAVLFWNGENKCFEVYLPEDGEFRDLNGRLLSSIEEH